MVQSTLHRLTGLFLCLGALLFMWGLVAAASGEGAWHVFSVVCNSWIGWVLLFVWTWSLLFHLCNGIQHLVHDAVGDFGPWVRDRRYAPTYWATGKFVIFVSVVLTIIVFIALAWRMNGGGT